MTMCPPAGRETELSGVTVQGCSLRAGAGASLLKIATRAKEESLAGYEFAAGIHGSLGGAIVMNASVRIYYPDGGIREFSGEDMAFGYRTSRLKKERGFVLSALIDLERGDRQAISDRITELAMKRKEKQPLEFASAGSTFKRPEGAFAGRLIEEAGLKGFSVGDAQVSEKHAGFVINRGGASAAQIRKLIGEVQRRVEENSGIWLEREVIYLGEF